LEGACANTKMLCVVPMSCVRGWIVAVTFAVVDVMLELTLTPMTGGVVDSVPLSPFRFPV